MENETTIADVIKVLQTYPQDRRVFVNGFDNPKTFRSLYIYDPQFDDGNTMTLEITSEDIDY